MDTKEFFTLRGRPTSREDRSSNDFTSLIRTTSTAQQPRPHFDPRSAVAVGFSPSSGTNVVTTAPTTEYSGSSRGSMISESSSGRNTPTTITGDWSSQRLQTKPPSLEEQAASAAQSLLEELQMMREVKNSSKSSNTSTSATKLNASDSPFEYAMSEVVVSSGPLPSSSDNSFSPPASHPPVFFRPPGGVDTKRPSGPDYAPKQSNFSEFLNRAEAERSADVQNRANGLVAAFDAGLQDTLQKRRLNSLTLSESCSSENGGRSSGRRDGRGGRSGRGERGERSENGECASGGEEQNSTPASQNSKELHSERQKKYSDLPTKRTRGGDVGSTRFSTSKTIKRAVEELSAKSFLQDNDENKNPYPDLSDIKASLFTNVHPNGRFYKNPKSRKLRMNLTQASTNYPVLPRVCKLMGWRKCKEDEGEGSHPEPIGDWTIAWRDTGAVSVSTVRDLIGGHAHRKINHFPGMGEICLKHCLGHHMNRMRKSFPKMYKHVPRTWVLPVDLASLKEFMASKRGKAITLICKPTHMCQGRGIYLTKKVPDFNPDLSDESAANKMLVVQQYISKPMLINNLKFDLRIYVAVTSCLPHMRAFIHREGLTRFCTTPYQAPTSKNIDCSFMHLTNYAVNKRNTEFVQPSVGNVPEDQEDEEEGEDDDDDDDDDDDVDTGEDIDKKRNRNISDEHKSSGSSPSNSEGSSSTHGRKKAGDDHTTGVPLFDRNGHHHGAFYDYDNLPPVADLTPEEAKELLQAQRGSKWSVTACMAWLAERGYDTKKIWKKIQEVISLTLLPIMQLLQHRYRASFSAKDDGFGCFELLGFDIMLDHRCVPILIEVNHSPSFETASPLDDVIKTTVIRDTLMLAGIDSETLLKTARGSDLTTKGTWNVKKKSTGEKDGDRRAGEGTKSRSDVTNAVGVAEVKVERKSSFGLGRPKGGGVLSFGPQMPIAKETKLKKGRRSEHEIQFIERLRTSYEKERMGGFERILPLPPDIDADTMSSEELTKQFELYNEVASIQTSLHRSSKTHESRLKEVQQRKLEREEKQAKLLRMMSRNSRGDSQASSRRQSSGESDNSKKVIGASSRLYPGPGRRGPTVAQLEQQRKDREHHERLANLTKFPEVPANKVALQPTVATLMMPASLMAQRNMHVRNSAQRGGLAARGGGIGMPGAAYNMQPSMYSGSGSGTGAMPMTTLRQQQQQQQPSAPVHLSRQQQHYQQQQYYQQQQQYYQQSSQQQQQQQQQYQYHSAHQRQHSVQSHQTYNSSVVEQPQSTFAQQYYMRSQFYYQQQNNQNQSKQVWKPH